MTTEEKFKRDIKTIHESIARAFEEAHVGLISREQRQQQIQYLMELLRDLEQMKTA